MHLFEEITSNWKARNERGKKEQREENKASGRHRAFAS